MPTPRISLCLIARDEAAVIESCLRSVVGAVDEMVVVDTGSVDGTEAIAAAKADIAFLLSGVDVVVGDRYGRLALTREGLRRRERLAQTLLRDSGIPVVLVLSGGYAETPRLTADLHAESHRIAAEVF